jgi:hypothetical protein
MGIFVTIFNGLLLFYESLCIAHYIASSGRMIDKRQIGSGLKEVVIFNMGTNPALSGGNEKIKEKPESV